MKNSSRACLFVAVLAWACVDPDCPVGQDKIGTVCVPRRDSAAPADAGEPSTSLADGGAVDALDGWTRTANDSGVRQERPADDARADAGRDPSADATVVTPDACASLDGAAPCDAHAGCADVDGQAVCACQAPYVGDGRTCTIDSSCSLLDCDKNAECVLPDGGAARQCQCLPGYSGSGATCRNIDECAAATSPCGPNETCKDSEGSFECSCSAGFERKGATCVELDECVSNPCAHGACLDQLASYSCDCMGSGYHGARCEIDDCSTTNCAPGTRCEHSTSGVQCVALCGNGLSDPGEACDWNAAGEIAGYSCTSDCQKITFLTVCDSLHPCTGNTVCARLSGSKSWCAPRCSLTTVACPGLPGVNSGGIFMCGALTAHDTSDNVTACTYRCESDADCPPHFECSGALVCLPK